MGLTETRTLGAAAHLSLDILASLRTAASAEAPLSPMLLSLTLRVRGTARMVRKQLCQGALTERRTLWGGGALEGGDLGLRQHGGDRLATVSAEVVVPDAASVGRRVRVVWGHWAGRAAPSPYMWFEGRPAPHLSEVIVALVCRAAASSSPPAAPSWLRSRSNEATW